MKTHDPSRRQLLGLSLGAAAVAAVPGFKAFAQGECKVSPAQTEGPFYPIEEQLDKDTDLTWVEGRSGRATGDVAFVKGVVRDEQCRPVEGVLVEIWQACATGKYNHVNDPNPAVLDTNFQYWGQALTRADGSYMFKTIVPGAYPADETWMRPPHIHFKLSKLGSFELITQMYWAGNPFNARDRILQALPAADRDKVVVRFTPAGEGHPPGSQVGVFDLVIRKVP